MIIFIDFDGTAIEEIASNRLLDRFASGDWQELNRKYDAQMISFRECVFEQFSMLVGQRQEMIEFVRDEIKLRAGFKEFINHCKLQQYDIHIVTEALDFMVEAVFEREQIFDIQIYSDRAIFEEGLFARVELPHTRPDCVCQLGNCKGGHVRKYHPHYDLKIFVGDGSNDLCAARESDLVFARRRLAELCQQHEIEFVPFEDFFVIRDQLLQYGL